MVERNTVITVHGEAEKEVTLDFEDILFFLTGSRYLPAIDRNYYRKAEL